MSDTGTVTMWLEKLKADDSAAATEIWQRYVGQLIRLARRKLGQAPRGASDEEDVVQSAFDAFFRGVGEARFPRLNDRDDLWQLLVVLTERKSIKLMRREGAAKRGKGRVHDGSDGLARVPASEPTPEFAAEMSEQLGRLMACLDDDLLRQIALGKLEGYTNGELAQNLSIGVRSVERKLSVIRRKWERESLA